MYRRSAKLLADSTGFCAAALQYPPPDFSQSNVM